MAAGLKAGLTRETLAALQRSQEARTPDFLLVRPESSAGRSASAVKSLEEVLPQVWQDLFAATRAAQSTEYLDGLACRPIDPPLSGSSSLSGPSGGVCGQSTDADVGAGPGGRDPALDITRDTAFAQFLSPEALVCQHRLGKPEVRRLYQAMQVYTLGFHQMCCELTAHAANRGLLLLAVWRAFAMLWDSALQVVFPAETVQIARERQAALLTSERLLEQLGEHQERSAALEQENAALRRQLDGMGVQVLSAQADLAVAEQQAAGVQGQLRVAKQQAEAAAAQEREARMEVLRLQDKLASLSGPGEDLLTRVGQLERVVKEKQGQLSAAAKQASEALAAKDEAKQAKLAERLARQAADRRAQELEAELESTRTRLAAAKAEAAEAAERAEAAVTARREAEAADKAARDDDTARIATERAGWQRQAVQAEAAAAQLQERLAACQASLQEEKSRNEQLVASMWPLAARIKSLEAAAAAASAGSGTAAQLGSHAPP